MATDLSAPVHDGCANELTDEQIEDLLSHAAARLREKAKLKEKQPVTGASFQFPKLDPGNLATVPATTKPAKKDDSIGLRKVDDPVQSKLAAKEVRFLVLS